LSSALLAAGEAHDFLPLTSATSVANDEVVAEISCFFKSTSYVGR
jgi:hypothetical protein